MVVYGISCLVVPPVARSFVCRAANQSTAPRDHGLSGFSTLFIAFGYIDDRPLHLVLDPVFIGWLYDFGLKNDACLNPCVFRLGWMQRKYWRTASAAKAPLDFLAAATDIPVT